MTVASLPKPSVAEEVHGEKEHVQLQGSFTHRLAFVEASWEHRKLHLFEG